MRGRGERELMRAADGVELVSSSSCFGLRVMLSPKQMFPVEEPGAWKGVWLGFNYKTARGSGSAMDE